MDIYYSVVGVDEPLSDFKDVNCNFIKDSFEDKIKILIHYCACLCLIAELKTESNKSNIIYRGIAFNSERKYTKGKNYRFASFQTCSNDVKIAEKYMKNREAIFLEISLPEKCKNCVDIQDDKDDSALSNEYVVMPYTSFKLDQIASKDLKDSSQSFENPKYSLTVSNEKFYNYREDLEELFEIKD